MNFTKETIELLRAMALAVTAAAWAQSAAATILTIDDLTDTPTISINGTPITSAGQTVGTFPNTQEVGGFLIQTNSPSHRETASINFDDFSLPPVGPPRTQYLDGHVLLTDPDGSISDGILVSYEYDTDPSTPSGTISQFRVQMESEVEGFPLPGCSPGRNCITLPETGNFQDITAAAFATMSVAFGPPGILTPPEGLTILVRSDLDTPNNTIPEPASLTLLGVGLAAISAIRRRKP